MPKLRPLWPFTENVSCSKGQDQNRRQKWHPRDLNISLVITAPSLTATELWFVTQFPQAAGTSITNPKVLLLFAAPPAQTHTQDSLARIHRVSRGTLRDALVVMNDILVAALSPRVLAFVVQVLAEAEVHAAPVLEVIVRRWAGVHTPAVQIEVAAGHALGGVVGLGAVAQALTVAAEAFSGAAVRLTDGGADWRERKQLVNGFAQFLSAQTAVLD